MRKILFLFLLVTIFGVSGYAQGFKARPLPAGIAGWSGADSDQILKNPIIKMRLKRLLGVKNYASLMESFETINPIKKNGRVLFTSGCLIHACSHLESAVAIDLANNTVHAAIFNETKKTRYFNERGSQTPEAIVLWAKRLRSSR